MIPFSLQPSAFSLFVDACIILPFLAGHVFLFVAAVLWVLEQDRYLELTFPPHNARGHARGQSSLFPPRRQKKMQD